MTKTIDEKVVGTDDFDFSIFNKKKKFSAEQKVLLSMYESYNIKSISAGDVTNVKYVGSNKEHFLFDGGFKDYVRIENKQSEAKYLVATEVGEFIDVYISEIEDDVNFMIKGTISGLYESMAHENLKSLEEGQSVSALVREMTPAGYNMSIFYSGITLPGFMPNTLAGINKLAKSDSIIGKTFDVMIESYSRDEGTYILSRRKYLHSLIPQAIKELKLGEVYTGNVTGTTDFGVFVEFNECLTGMVHKSNLNTDWQDRISQITPGYEIDFYIKEVINGRNGGADKIILTQILRETLWDTIRSGQVLDASVKDIKSFGALVSLDEETNGLIHNSELEKAGRKLRSGDNLKVKVILADRMNRKIFLSVV